MLRSVVSDKITNATPRPLRRLLKSAMHLSLLRRGFALSRGWGTPSLENGAADSSNPLRSYCAALDEGPGIIKWDHYLDVYHRHFSRFRGKPVRILEIGIYSGGSLGMWRRYFGPDCQVYGVDIDPRCKAYEADGVSVFIGNQADRGFWETFKDQVPSVDIVVDDGGHKTDQQVVSLEELLPHVRPGGVYVCEDVHGAFNGFMSYMNGFVHNLNGSPLIVTDDDKRRIVSPATEFQSAIGSTSFYPFIVVIEKRDAAIREFVTPKYGTQWQP